MAYFAIAKNRLYRVNDGSTSYGHRDVISEVRHWRNLFQSTLCREPAAQGGADIMLDPTKLKCFLSAVPWGTFRLTEKRFWR